MPGAGHEDVKRRNYEFDPVDGEELPKLSKKVVN